MDKRVVNYRCYDAPGNPVILASSRVGKDELFIGSAKVGTHIGQMCAKYLKPILMELGEKGPAIVLGDADLKQDARTCAIGGERVSS